LREETIAGSDNVFIAVATFGTELGLARQPIRHKTLTDHLKEFGLLMELRPAHDLKAPGISPRPALWK
jgi:hypothetical protein